nr:hypothetical protein [Halosolutus gelatinilyticus]
MLPLNDHQVVDVLLAALVVAIDVGQLHALAHSRFDGIDRRAKLEEHTERRQLPVKGDDVHVLLPQDAVAMEIAPTEIVEVVDPLPRYTTRRRR